MAMLKTRQTKNKRDKATKPLHFLYSFSQLFLTTNVHEVVHTDTHYYKDLLLIQKNKLEHN